ncbi:MAG: porin [Akkermansiaceae bacterium]
MENNVVKTIIGAIALSGAAVAGPIDAPVVAQPESNSGDFCSTLQNFGMLYNDKSNPFIQEVSVFGRFQGQYAYVDGSDVNGKDFNNDFEEVRRLRAGMKIKAFNGLQIKGNVNLEDDDKPTGGDREFGYQDFDQMKFSYKKKDIMGFDSLELTYGRHKIEIGSQSHTSSKKIKTVERSALSNKIADGRFTGFTLDFERGGLAGTLGFLSLDDSDFIGNWDAGNAIYASTSVEALGGDILFDVFYNMDQGTDDDQIEVGYEWVASAAWNGQVADWDLMVNLVVGDNGEQSNSDREGAFYGLVVMPSKYIIEDKLEFVTRYQFQGSSEEEGVRMNSRYVRRAELGDTDLGGGRGDAHHSIYAGLNYFFCGHNSKIMTGVEYETLTAQDGDVDATTLWLAYRMYF